MSTTFADRYEDAFARGFEPVHSPPHRIQSSGSLQVEAGDFKTRIVPQFKGGDLSVKKSGADFETIPQRSESASKHSKSFKEDSTGKSFRKLF